MTHRDHSLDTWKGVAIIFVIGIHACNVAITLPPESINHWIGLTFRALFNFAVALFFVISGYLAPGAAEIQKRGIIRYYYRRLIPIWIPYLLWTSLYLVLRQSPFDLEHIAKAIFIGRGIGIGYFVIVLTFLILIHPFFALLSRKKTLLISATISILSVAALYWARIEYPNHHLVKFPSLTSISFTTWMIFYYLGFYIRTNPITKMQHGFLLCAITVSFFLSVTESIFISTSLGAPALAASQVKVTTYLYAISLSILALQYGSGILGKVGYLAWAGKRSYVLYLSHMLFLKPITQVFGEFSIIRNNQLIEIPLSLVTTVLAASACIAISERLLPPQLAFYILGIRENTQPSVELQKRNTSNQ